MRNGKTHLTDLTRREALERIGKFGSYLPATMAVLTAAPRAFAQSADTATLEGRVTDCANVAVPVVGATVCVECDVVRSDTTDDNGEYRIRNIPAGEWLVLVGAPGYHGVAMLLTFVAGEVMTSDPCVHPLW